ncbi:HD domain-containing protein [Clostridia bacterium OttesenSCG-928-F22]|nr:HD domain-containing protein [Clostridia bacterium OttesenSCG-928-F22]
MRINKAGSRKNNFSILALDDDKIMTITLQSYFQSSGFHVDVENDPEVAVERIRNGNYDILLLDFLMRPICGDEVVARIRKFNKEIFIILLTGHKSMAPPIKTIRELDIQGYYEKSDRFDQLELLVESCIKSIKHIRTINRYRDGLKETVNATPQIYQLKQPEKIIGNILNTAATITGSADAFITLQPQREADGGEVLSPLYYGIGAYASTREVLEKEPLRKTMRSWENREQQQGVVLIENILLCALTDEKGKLRGMMGLAMTEEVSVDILHLVETFSLQAGAAISNSQLHQVIQGKNEELSIAYDRLNESYMEIISAVRLIVDAKDIYTRGHSDRVAYYAKRIAEVMGKDEDYCERIRVAGLFHDVGKIGTADDVLTKSGVLSINEYEEIKQHTTRGARILSAITMLKDLAPVAHSHHERYDGTGYPQGLKGKEIPEQARIIAVADAFDAMTSHRIYRTNLSVEQAIKQLEEGKGTQFDAEMVDVFVSILNEHYENIKTEVAWTFTHASAFI